MVAMRFVPVVLALLVFPAAAMPPTLDELAAEAPADAVGIDLPEDMRRNAMKTAAIRYGAQAGLAHRGWEIARILERFAPQLARIYRFRDLMIHEAGFMVQPPVLAETRQAFHLDRSQERAASAGRHLKIITAERIVSAVPDWRDFLVRRWGETETPAALLFPRSAEEKDRWRAWLEEGWDEGRELADLVFMDDLDRLTGFFEGLVLWHRLHRARMVSRPVLSLHRNAVSGGGDGMLIDESLMTIEARAALVARPDLWLPLDGNPR